ncbi:MAG TPA: transporter [Thermoanaerobaculia bacterium]|nr:transporter [Thermoanaerobaculia bacterium]
MRTALLFMLSVFSFSALAQQAEAIVADRPGFADGAATVGTGVFQVEAGLSVDRQGDESVTVPTLLRFGLGNRLELRIESDLVGLHDGDADVAPIGAGVKLRLTEGAMPLSLIAKVQPPSGEGDLGTDGFEGEARLVSDIDLGADFSLTPNVGFSVVEGDGARAIFAVTLEKQLGNALPFVDVELTAGDGETSAIADAGVAWIVGRNLQLDVSAGFDVAGDAYPEWFVAAGVSRRF